jgi:hypothetical protein
MLPIKPAGGNPGETMNITATIHIHHHEPSTAVLDALKALDRRITQMADTINEAIDRLTTVVTKQSTVIDSMLE